MPRRRRTPLPLSPRGSFVFTEKTVSVDLSRTYGRAGETSGKTILHVGRSRGALEFPGSAAPAVEIDAETVLDLIHAENLFRKTAPGLKPEERAPVALDPRVVSQLRNVAKQSHGPALPLAGRPRRCWESSGAHSGEWLWMDTQTGRAVLETRTPDMDDAGNARGYSSTARDISPAEAVEWLKAEGVETMPSVLFEFAGGKWEIRGPSEPFTLSGEPRPAKRPRRPQS